MKRFTICAAFAFLFTPSLLLSQTSTTDNGNENLQTVMKKLFEGAAKSYVNPVVSGFGTDLNSGWYHRAPWAKMFGFDFEFGVVAMATLFEDANRTFSSQGAFRFDSSQAAFLAQNSNAPAQYQGDVTDAILSQEFQVAFNGPTIAGKNTDSVKVAFPGKTITVNTSAGPQNFTLPSQLFALPVTGLMEDAPVFPLGAPQLTIGTFLGSQFTFRYLPEVELENIGAIKFFGWGVQHNPMVWFGEDALPFEVSLSYFSQNLKAGSIMDVKASSFGLNASIRIGWGFLNLTPYLGYMKENAKMNFAYDVEFDAMGGGREIQHIAFELESENASRFTFGVGIKILLINVNADVNLGKYKAYSLGAMISI